MPTLHDVARKSGVTAATVSNVIRNKGSVGDATRQRVLQAIEELGYRPNLMARGLVEGKSFTLALMVKNIANPFYGEVALEIERIAREKGYHLLLYNAPESPGVQQGLLDHLPGSWVDGIITVAGMTGPEALELYRQGRSIVLGNWHDFDDLPDVPSVDIDFWQVGYLVGQHLVGLGHRRIAAVIGGNAKTRKPFHVKRLQGFRQALSEASISLQDSYLEFAESTDAEGGYHATKAFLELEEPPTAIFAANDFMAVGALEAAKDRGLQVPEALSIIGVDDIVFSTHIRPALTTVSLSKKPFAEAIMRLLMDQLERRELPEKHIWITPYLVERQSTTAPRYIAEQEDTARPEKV